MATSDERQKIAEKMRGPFDVCECPGHTYINGTLFGMQVCAKDEQSLRDGMRHLADLIDPTCRIVSGDTDNHMPHCNLCGTGNFDLLPKYCKGCGARIVYNENVN